MWLNLALLAVAGAIGTLARYGLSVCIKHAFPSAFPWPTFTVNMLGCFLFGLVVALFDARADWNPHTKLVLLTGFMGAFTTFSTFAFETSALAREGQLSLAIANVVSQNVIGVLALFLGVIAGRSV